MKLLVLRPRVGADATVARAARAGFDALTAPLFHYRALPWSAPDPATIDAVLLTSAAAVRLGGGGLNGLLAVPVQAVGRATAEAARDAGFGRIVAASGDGSAAAAMLAADGHHVVLHLAGRDHIPVDHPMLSITRIPVYAADAVECLPDAVGPALDDGAIVLLHSPRAARLFMTLLDHAGRTRVRVRIACFSQAVADAAGTDWAGIAVAAAPTDDALFAAARLLCDQSTNGMLEPR